MSRNTQGKKNGRMERKGKKREWWNNGMLECWKEDLFVSEGILPITQGLLSLERFNQFKQPILDFVVELV
jgi:hypothetical protein